MITDVRSGEATTALILSLNVFLLLLAYYLAKTVREPLILGTPGGAATKAYSSVFLSLLLLAWVPAYGLVAQRFGRMKLITYVTFFFASCLVIFAILGALDVHIGVPFFLWTGLFGLSVVAQFWAFAADVYTPEQGKRLFVILGIGSSVGAAAGGEIAALLLKGAGSFGGIGPYFTMLAAAFVLLVCLALTRYIHRREEARKQQQGGAPATTAPMEKGGAFALVLSDRYLLLIATLMLVLNCANTIGEYILDRTLIAEAGRQMLGAKDSGKFIGAYKGHYFTLINLFGLMMQFFVVSRIIKHLGVRIALFVMPVVALVGYTGVFLQPVLNMVRTTKIGENGLDYSLQNTIRNALFLPTSREAKYKAKTAIDTFFVRGGDAVAAAVVYAGTAWSWETGHFALFNLGLIGVWLVIVAFIGKAFAERAAQVAAANAPEVEGQEAGDTKECPWCHEHVPLTTRLIPVEVCPRCELPFRQ